MERQRSTNIRTSVKFLVVMLILAGMFLNSVSSFAEDTIPFHAMMQSNGSNTAVLSAPDANNGPAQIAGSGHITKTGRAEIGAGFLLIGAGVLTIAATAALSGSGYRPSGGKSTALYVVGAGAAGAGVTFVILGFHKRPAK